MAYQANKYMLKVNNRNTKRRCEIYSKFTLRTQEPCHWRHWLRSGVFVVNFGLFLKCSLAVPRPILGHFTTSSGVSIVDFEQLVVRLGSDLQWYFRYCWLDFSSSLKHTHTSRNYSWKHSHLDRYNFGCILRFEMFQSVILQSNINLIEIWESLFLRMKTL